MSKELAHSFNIHLPEPEANQIKQIQEKLTLHFDDCRQYDKSAHVSILTKFMDESHSSAFSDALKKEFAHEKPWILECSHLAPSEGNTYIFLHFTEESKQRLFAIHERAVNVTQEIGSEGKDGLPAKYAFDPHISIIKILPENMNDALALIEMKLNIEITVDSYEITRQLEDGAGFTSYPVIANIFLNESTAS